MCLFISEEIQQNLIKAEAAQAKSSTTILNSQLKNFCARDEQTKQTRGGHELSLLFLRKQKTKRNSDMKDKRDVLPSTVFSCASPHSARYSPSPCFSNKCPGTLRKA